ncbi:hypothetical protein [Bradyrhizobium sp.]|uniref:hypothetical protein n=1 Tax=Bradyrhizobium sp. TaxID=376 RepID=UPI0025C6D8F0|nr:hypothetical protein [Bradyrhizobium sp.]
MTLIAALRHDRISAPWVIDSPINGELFRLYVEKVLAPTHAGRNLYPRQSGSHKRPARLLTVPRRAEHSVRRTFHLPAS